jgi:DNA-binding XRE family transcriptional regulator
MQLASKPCDACEKGTMRATRKDVDISDLVGLSEVIVPDANVLACDNCDNFAMGGIGLDAYKNTIAKDLVETVDRLSGDEARYLRKLMLLTQNELAEKLGIDRMTILRWEGEPHVEFFNSYALRALVSAWLTKRGIDVVLPDSASRGIKEPKKRHWEMGAKQAVG